MVSCLGQTLYWNTHLKDFTTELHPHLKVNLYSPRLLFRIFTTVGVSRINISQLTQEFSRTSGNRCMGNLTLPSGESAHYAIGKIKMVSDWQIQENNSERQMVKMQRAFNSPIKIRL